MVKKKKKVKSKNIKRSAKKKTPAKSASPKKLLKEEVLFYKKLLLKARELAGGELSHIAKDALKKSQRDASGDLSGYSYHMADVASDNYEMEFSLGRATDEQSLLYAIDEALKRIDDKTYGFCMTCEKRISKERLRIVPHAALCIDCQKKNEIK